MWSELLDLFYPNLCVICTGHLSKSEEQVCFACLFNLPKTNHFDVPDNALAKNLWGRVNVKQAAALFEFKKGNPVHRQAGKCHYVCRQPRTPGRFWDRKSLTENSSGRRYRNRRIHGPGTGNGKTVVSF